MRKTIIAVAIFVIFGLTLFQLVNYRRAHAETPGVFYVPGDTCKKCHRKIYIAYSKQPHAKALEALKCTNQENDPHCLPCHTTGYGKPGGFLNEDSTKHLAGVTCQACHGPGSKHVELGLNAKERVKALVEKPDQACTKCHKIHAKRSKPPLPVLKMKLAELQKQIKNAKK